MIVLREYTHLKAAEKAIAKRWVTQVPIQGRREWDVHLKVQLLEAPAWWSKKDYRNWHAVNDKRIDLVVHSDKAIWIMEITPKLSKAAIGGCQVYKELYEKEFKPKLPVKMGIIVEMDDPNYHSMLEKLGITLWVV